MPRILTNLRAGKKMGFDYTITKHTSDRYATVKWSLTPYAYNDPSGDPGNATYHLLHGGTSDNWIKIEYTARDGDENTIKHSWSNEYTHNGNTIHRGYTDHNSWLDENKNGDEWFDTNGNWTGIRRWLKVLGTDWASGEFNVKYNNSGKASFHLSGEFNCYSASSSQGTMKFSDTVSLESIPAKYTITYKANGGTNSGDNDQTKLEGTSITLFKGTNFSRKYFDLKRWDTKSDGSGKSYKLGGTYSANASDTLYAIWERIEYTIKYKPNGGSIVDDGDDDQIKQAGIDKTLFKGTKFKKTGYDLKKWNTKSDGSGDSYKLEGTYTGNHDLTLYAIWEPEQNGVTLLDYFTGSKYDSFTATYNSKLTSAQLKKMNSYSKAGYELLGWSKTKVDVYKSTPTQAELAKYRWNQEGVFKETSAIKLWPILKYMTTVYVRVNNEWKLAIPYVRVNGEWKQAMAYVRVNNEWKL